MQIYCPFCRTQLAAQDVEKDQAKCHSCERTFSIAEAATEAKPVRALTASESLRIQLDKMTKNPKS